jgi:hypothetical protein
MYNRAWKTLADKSEDGCYYTMIKLHLKEHKTTKVGGAWL